MGTTAEKLNYIADTKSTIRNAIESKGVEVEPSVPFRDYADKIIEIKGVEEYAPPSDWPDISNPPENTIRIIFCDWATLDIGFTVWSQGIYTVDWGDGSAPDKYNSGNKAQHSYPKGSGTPCSRGYYTWVCSITGAITGFRNDRHSSIGTSSSVFPALGMTINVPGLETMNNAFEYYSTGTMLEYVEFTGAAPNLTSMGSVCKGCGSLRRFVFPSSAPLLSNLDSAFYYAYSLTEVVYPDALPSVTTLYQAHRENYNIQKVILPADMSSLQDLRLCFLNCYSLQELSLPESYEAVSLNNLVQNCVSLKTITGLSTSHVSGQVNYSDAFVNVRNITEFVITNKISAVAFNSSDGNMRSKTTSIRLTNPGSLFEASATVNVSRTMLGVDALVQLFEDLPSLTGKIINISDCAGTPFLLQGQKNIILNKGWTITG